MGHTIDQGQFSKVLFALLEETFTTHHGMYLNKGTSFFETLETVSAAEASLPVGQTGATLAAQVAHVTFYLEVLESFTLGKDAGQVDWGAIWRTVKGVTPAEWESSKQQLRKTYERISNVLHGISEWNETAMGGSLSMVVHTAYHLGGIRQALRSRK